MQWVKVRETNWSNKIVVQWCSRSTRGRWTRCCAFLSTRTSFMQALALAADDNPGGLNVFRVRLVPENHPRTIPGHIDHLGGDGGGGRIHIVGAADRIALGDGEGQGIAACQQRADAGAFRSGQSLGSGVE